MLDFPRFLLYLAVMAGVTYLVRLLPLLFVRKKIESRFINSLLYYMPYSVLTVMTFPAMFYATGHILSAVLACGVALVLAWKNKNLMLVATSAALTALATEAIYLLF